MTSWIPLWKSLLVFSDTAQQIARAHGPNPNIPSLKQEWARKILDRVGLDLRIVGQPSFSKSVLFVGNHVSYLDIPLLMAAVPGISFVAKKEVRRWPIFGYGADLIETVFVDRGDRDSRSRVRQTIAYELERGKRIALFPAGTTTLTESVDWRRGAFEIAQKHAAWIQPFRIRYAPARAAAYIDDDFFPTHLMNLVQQSRLQAEIEFHPPVEVVDPETSRVTCQAWCRSMGTA